MSEKSKCIVRKLGLNEYVPVWNAMKAFTQQRNATTLDEIWMLEHQPVFTQGQAGKEEHLLNTGDIPIVQVDRGGQVTYHGPGQLVIYFLVDIKRKKIGVRALVTAIENIVIQLLSNYGIESRARNDAPGVYIDDKKICSLGLKIKQGRSFHGLALNVNMDKTPFLRINPCGYEGMEITQICEQGVSKSLEKIENDIQKIIFESLDFHQIKYENNLPELD